MLEQMELLNLKTELEQTPRVQSVHLDMEPPISPLTLEILENVFAFSLNSELLEAYKVANGIRLTWYYDSSGGRRIGGEVNVQGCLDTFSEDASSVLGCSVYGDEEGPDTAQTALCREMKIFDRYEKSLQSTRSTTLRHKENHFERLWFWDTDGDKYPLALSPLEYLEAMVWAKAQLNWQYFYLALDEIDSSNSFLWRNVYGTTLHGTVAEMETFCELRRELFGVKDLDYFRERLEQTRALVV